MSRQRMEWEVTGGFFLVISVALYWDTTYLTPLALVAAACHEMGHYLATVALGGRVLRLRLTAVGGDMWLDKAYPLSDRRELLCVLAGPVTNLVMAVVLAQWAGGRQWLQAFAGLHLALGLFNLLPLYPLDGGRCLRLMLPCYATQIGRVVDGITLAGLLLVALWGVGWTRGGMSLLGITLWLALAMVKRERKSQI